VDSLLASFLQLPEDLLGPVNLGWLAVNPHPTLTGGEFNSKGIFQCFQKLEIVGVEALEGAGTLELKGACFCHCAAERGLTGDITTEVNGSKTSIPDPAAYRKP